MSYYLPVAKSHNPNGVWNSVARADDYFMITVFLSTYCADAFLLWEFKGKLSLFSESCETLTHVVIQALSTCDVNTRTDQLNAKLRAFYNSVNY